MQLNAFSKGTRFGLVAVRKTLRIMKAVIVMTLVFCLQASAKTFSQEITLSLNNANLETAIKEIQRQTDYKFVYTKAQMDMANKVSLEVKKEKLETVLELCFKDQPLTYVIEENVIAIAVKEKPIGKRNSLAPIDITGQILNEQGEPIAGATILVKGTNKGTSSDENGKFILQDVEPNSILIISSIGYQTEEVSLRGRSDIFVQLKLTINSLDETVVKGYYNTSKRLNTGSVGKVTAKEISTQPVSNPLAALQGRVPGLQITQTSGIPGSSFQIQLRGKNSIAQGNDPLIIIDGVPFAPNNTNINQVGAAFSFDGNGLSPLSIINPADIERIEILKDADATAIYGSRGANGVILITTKKGESGKSKVDFKIYNGFSKVSRRPKMLTTSQYIGMRREAFANDGTTPTASNAYDILVWDTTRYTDWVDEFIGGTANTVNASISFSGGSQTTKFLFSNSFNRETTVYPGDLSNSQISPHFNLNHISISQRFHLSFSTTYSYGNNKIIINDLAKSINLPPNLPKLYNDDGSLNWSSGGFTFTNPLAALKQSYTAKIETFIANASLKYKLIHNLSANLNVGYNSMHVDEVSTNPISAKNPANNPTGTSQFGNTQLMGLILEPQVESFFNVLNGKLELLLGASWQRNNSETSFLLGTGYTNDALLKSPSAASSLTVTNSEGEYKYAAMFGRASYNLKGRYLLNLTMRRDGSSRFGPDRQYAMFGALGAGWIFSEEKFFAETLQFINYGKLRASYGTSGNDNIGDYQYIDKYKSTTYTYQGSPGLYPSNLFNPDYSWEVNKKLEVALEMGMCANRLFFTGSYYRNRSSNQLIQYSLPSQTGFNSITKNFPALIQNNGIELELSFNSIKKQNFTWQTSFNISFPRNKLVSFPDIANSSYRNQYLVGYPLNIGSGFYFAGVNAQTGIYEFLDIDGNITSSPLSPRDIIKGLADLNPSFFGGFTNNISYKGWQLDFHLEFREQTGVSYLYNFISTPPGTRFNQPLIVLERWQKPGDVTNIQRFTTTVNNPAYQANNQINFNGAENKYTDASYLRLKNISLAYNFNSSILKKIKADMVRLFLQAQNLFTISDYYGGDPETQNALRLPPLRTIAVGIQLTF